MDTLHRTLSSPERSEGRIEGCGEEQLIGDKTPRESNPRGVFIGTETVVKFSIKSLSREP